MLFNVTYNDIMWQYIYILFKINQFKLKHGAPLHHYLSKVFVILDEGSVFLGHHITQDFFDIKLGQDIQAGIVAYPSWVQCLLTALIAPCPVTTVHRRSNTNRKLDIAW